MNPFDSKQQPTLEAIAQRHGFSVDAARAMLAALRRGNGSMAQFNHAEFGGAGQWMRGGMTMVSDMFNQRLKSAVDAVCVDLAAFASSRRAEPDPAGPSSAFQSQNQSAGARPSPEDAGSRPTSGRWWPDDLGVPNSSGSQNTTRYAYFAGPRRLAVDTAGQVTVYDTGDHRIGGVSQQQSGGSDLRFTSQLGAVDLGQLEVVTVAGAADAPKQSPVPDSPRHPPRAPAGFNTADPTELIRKLADLHASGILTDAEFNDKKAELLGRL